MTDPWTRASAEIRAELAKSARETPQLLAIVNRVGELARCHARTQVLPALDALMSEGRNLGIRILVGVEPPATNARRRGSPGWRRGAMR